MLSYDKLQDIVRRKSNGLFVRGKTRLHDLIGVCDVTDDIDLCCLFTTQVEVRQYRSAIIILKANKGTRELPTMLHRPLLPY